MYINFGWGSVPDPGGDLIALPDPIAGWEPRRARCPIYTKKTHLLGLNGQALILSLLDLDTRPF